MPILTLPAPPTPRADTPKKILKKEDMEGGSVKKAGEESNHEILRSRFDSGGYLKKSS